MNWMWSIRQTEGVALETFQIQGGELIAISVVSPALQGNNKPTLGSL